MSPRRPDDPNPNALLREAYTSALSRAMQRPTVFQVTEVLEEMAIAEWGPGTQVATTAHWERGLTRLGLNSTREIMDALDAMRLPVAVGG